MLSATFADDSLFSMLVVVPVIDEFRIVGDDELLYTPALLVLPVEVAVTLFIVGDDELLYTP